ncbi:phosphotransferase [Alcaligenaceae bacterium CGII-47]|nr:phosphotransferase [Alcaligenaceae bacterium CGII-47]
MNSSSLSKSDPRLDALRQWLNLLPDALGIKPDTLAPASGDASFRRYFRIQSERGALIVMDAPPPDEDCHPFVQIAAILSQAGLNVPAIFAQDTTQGFLLLSDLGRQTYYDAIQMGLDGADLQTRYRQALHALVQIQSADTLSLPVYDQSRLLNELALFPHWYIGIHCGVTLDADQCAMLERTFALLTADNAQQPQVFVHRDFHSPNLMINEAGADQPPGIIDFQDALAGPISYDIASLVMDARTTWEEPQQLDWAIRYWEIARAASLPVPTEFSQFHRQYEWMSLQRNLRILGVFARLSHRDAKHHYLAHLPRVQTYVRQVASRYSVFFPLIRLLDIVEQRPTRTGFSF